MPVSTTASCMAVCSFSTDIGACVPSKLSILADTIEDKLVIN